MICSPVAEEFDSGCLSERRSVRYSQPTSHYYTMQQNTRYKTFFTLHNAVRYQNTSPHTLVGKMFPSWYRRGCASFIKVCQNEKIPLPTVFH